MVRDTISLEKAEACTEIAIVQLKGPSTYRHSHHPLRRLEHSEGDTWLHRDCFAGRIRGLLKSEGASWWSEFEQTRVAR